MEIIKTINRIAVIQNSVIRAYRLKNDDVAYAIVDKLYSKLDTLKANLRDIRTQGKRYRKQIRIACKLMNYDVSEILR